MDDSDAGIRSGFQGLPDAGCCFQKFSVSGLRRRDELPLRGRRWRELVEGTSCLAQLVDKGGLGGSESIEADEKELGGGQAVPRGCKCGVQL